MMYSKWRSLCGILSLTASLAMLGCGSTGNSNVRAVNASQGLSNFTIQVGQTGIVGGLPFGAEGVQQPGQYATLDTSGNYRMIGAGANLSLTLYQQPGTTPLVSTTQTFLKNTGYTIVALAQAASVEMITLTDDNTAPQSGDYKLRVMDTSTIAGPVDIYITAVGAGVGGTPVVGNIQFQQVVNALQLTPGTLEVQVTPAGNPSVVLARQAFSPAGGKDYSIFFLDPPIGGAAIDPPGGGPNQYGVLVVNDPVAM